MPAETKHHPGKLSICIKMSVMIKKNKATECNVTNGAEGIVVGQKSKPIDNEHQTLEVLFVQLTSLSKPIQLEGLPLNVVPVTTKTIHMTVTLSNGNKSTISRSQISVVLNFEMTDFGSQEHTQQYNVCDLQNCHNHQSIYTYLSQGSTYEGTLLVQGFNASNLTGGLFEYLRQEFL